MPTLFEPTTINGKALGNRFVRSATAEGLATADGTSTPLLEAMLSELASGGVGLVIAGYAYVSPEGKDEAGQLGVCSDEQVPGLTGLASAVHAAGGAAAPPPPPSPPPPPPPPPPRPQPGSRAVGRR